jgi:hypothetical protein
MTLKLDSTLDALPRLDKFGFVSKTSNQPFFNDQNIAT